MLPPIVEDTGLAAGAALSKDWVFPFTVLAIVELAAMMSVLYAVAAIYCSLAREKRA